MYEFWCDYVKPKYGGKAKNYATQIQITLEFAWKQKIFTQVMQKIIKQDLVLQIKN